MTRKPGANIPNAERHTVQRLVRLRPEEDAALIAVADARGVPVSRAVGQLAIEARRQERNAPTAGGARSGRRRVSAGRVESAESG